LQRRRLEGFKKRKIWYPTASSLNDPYECYPDFVTNEDDIVEIVESLTSEEFIFITKEQEIEQKEGLIRILKDYYATTPSLSSIGKGLSLEGLRKMLFLPMISAVSTYNFSNIGVLSLTQNPLDLKMWAHYGGNSTGVCIEFERNSRNLLGSSSTKRVTYMKKRSKINFHERHQKKEEIIASKSKAWKDAKEWRHWRDKGNKLYPFPRKFRVTS